MGAERTPASLTDEELLATGEVRLLGRITGSSNIIFLVEVASPGSDQQVRAVYKPVAGERPLWDFPDGTLAAREHLTWAVARALGWDLVPATVLRDGPHGPGSFQAWVDDDTQAPWVDVVPAEDARAGWIPVLGGEDEQGRPVTVVHRDVPELRRLALLDVVVNNSDRKGGHVLTGPGGTVRGIDHGLTFHADPKLRTVLWGWVGEPLATDEAAALRGLATALDGALGDRIRELLSDEESRLTAERVASLLELGHFPAPDGRWPSVPWPPF